MSRRLIFNLGTGRFWAGSGGWGQARLARPVEEYETLYYGGSLIGSENCPAIYVEEEIAETVERLFEAKRRLAIDMPNSVLVS